MLQVLEPGNCTKMVVRCALICLCRLLSAQLSEGELIVCGMQRRENCVPYWATCLMVTQCLCTMCLACPVLGSGRCVRCVSCRVSNCHICPTACSGPTLGESDFGSNAPSLTTSSHEVPKCILGVRLSECAHTRDLANDTGGGGVQIDHRGY
jgi:hypothetical protein